MMEMYIIHGQERGYCRVSCTNGLTSCIEVRPENEKLKEKWKAENTELKNRWQISCAKFVLDHSGGGRQLIGRHKSQTTSHHSQHVF